MKKIVTHKNPDIDALGSIWLIKRFLPGWSRAEVVFVPAGSTYHDEPADTDPNILHVDTGCGELDHHQFIEIISAAELTRDHVFTKIKGKPLKRITKEAITRLVDVITEIDNGRVPGWAESKLDRSQFYFDNILYGLRKILGKDSELIEYGLPLMDGLLDVFKDKVRAEEFIDKKGIVFKSRWGKAIACETGNEVVLWEAQKRGFILVVKYSPKFNGRVKIFSRYNSKVDFTLTHKTLSKIDPKADWFLHASKKLLLISSHPKATGTSLALEEIIKVLKK